VNLIYKKKSIPERIFGIVIVAIMLFICFITLYPVWNIIVTSLNNGKDAMLGPIYWWPREFTIDNYRAVFSHNQILTSFKVTIFRTLIATTLNVFFTAMVAYALSKKQLRGRSIYMSIGLFSMFFGGGLIPYFLLLTKLGFIDKFIVYVIPTMFNFYNLLIFQAFFREIPGEMEEAAKIDGANDFMIFIKLILPLSKPVVATIVLFVGVYNWNDYFMGTMFVNRDELLPIQTYLFRIISQSSGNSLRLNIPAEISAARITSQSIKLATMVITTLPIVVLYPFLQKYFVKGMMLGGVKG